MVDIRSGRIGTDRETERQECPLRHKNGNCSPVGGFCTSVNNEICTALHNAYTKGYSDGVAVGKKVK